MPRKERKPSPGYGHELIRLERPRAELCCIGEGNQVNRDRRISHICQWRYKRKGAEVIVRRWVCRGCAVAWARKHIWTMAKASGQKTLFTEAELKGAG